MKEDYKIEITNIDGKIDVKVYHRISEDWVIIDDDNLKKRLLREIMNKAIRG